MHIKHTRNILTDTGVDATFPSPYYLLSAVGHASSPPSVCQFWTLRQTRASVVCLSLKSQHPPIRHNFINLSAEVDTASVESEGGMLGTCVQRVQSLGDVSIQYRQTIDVFLPRSHLIVVKSYLSHLLLSLRPLLF
jgi:hypothetical protein